MKKASIFGTGVVGKTIGNKLISLGYEVMMGSRMAGNEKAIAWKNEAGQHAYEGNFEQAAQFSDLIFNCTKGEHAKNVFELAGIANLKNKIIIDISNPLDFSNGMPPSLIPELSNTYSLGEELQKTAPESFIIKTLNTVNCDVMVNPAITNGEPTMFLSGNSSDAKRRVVELLKEFGWKDIIDLGDITTSRGTESLLPIWLRIYISGNNPHFGFKIITSK